MPLTVITGAVTPSVVMTGLVTDIDGLVVSRDGAAYVTVSVRDEVELSCATAVTVIAFVPACN
jgi:hypothetical protein